ncbi:class I adenylate-forming enzyme family protein [Brevibacillus thermoruber]|uniref:class I adenylate-forming enzyme family protein n=1 Tax=Brevibacillus thermoruber TaxID=33942 RepID=UPI000419D21D|nr:class I adenylate-forming enzyme family protein [Brevibacillus thermoruber]
MNMNLGSLFEFSANRYPNQIAVVQGQKRYTYGQLHHESSVLAYSLQKLGVGKRDRVIVLMKNRVETIIAFWALQKIGAVFTPINLRMSTKDIQYCVNDVEAKMIIFEDLVRTSVLKNKYNTRPLFIGLEPEGADLTFHELLEQGKGSCERPPIDDNDLAVILYTSGTTGRPKGVPRTHKNEYASTMAHILQNNYLMFDKTLGAMPLYHTMGLHALLSVMLVLNGTYVTVPDFDAHEALRLIQEEGIHSLYMIPKMYHDMAYHPDVDRYDYSTLRTIGFAGSSMSAELIQRCQEVFRPQTFVNHYGSTEIYTFTTCSEVLQKPGCAGKPGIHQLIRVIVPNQDGSSHPDDTVSPGEIGEIIVHTDSVEAFKGYWNRPDATRKAIREGWYFTGDLGYIDEQGDLYVIGRVDEMIISGGEHIHPQEIEMILLEHPHVSQVAVVGVKDKRWGEIPVAYIVPRSQVTPQELDQFCKEHPRLASYKRPREYVFVSEIPESLTGKTLRRKLAQIEREEKEISNVLDQ